MSSWGLCVSRVVLWMNRGEGNLGSGLYLTCHRHETRDEDNTDINMRAMRTTGMTMMFKLFSVIRGAWTLSFCQAVSSWCSLWMVLSWHEVSCGGVSGHVVVRPWGLQRIEARTTSTWTPLQAWHVVCSSGHEWEFMPWIVFQTRDQTTNRSTILLFSLFLLLRLSRSLSQFETQDIKTQPHFNHYFTIGGAGESMSWQFMEEFLHVIPSGDKCLTTLCLFVCKLSRGTFISREHMTKEFLTVFRMRANLPVSLSAYRCGIEEEKRRSEEGIEDDCWLRERPLPPHCRRG